jgi:hypothetical protein
MQIGFSRQGAGGGGSGGGGLTYKGSWDADTNTPTLGDGGAGGDSGEYYIVSVAGSTSLDGESDWQAGDWVVNNDASQVDNDSTVTGSTVKDALETLEAADGDFIAGPASVPVVEDGIPTFDGTTGRLVKESGAKVETAPAGGSGFTFVEYASTPVSPPAGMVWIQAKDASTKTLNYFDGIDTYSVDLSV